MPNAFHDLCRYQVSDIVEKLHAKKVEKTPVDKNKLH